MTLLTFIIIVLVAILSATHYVAYDLGFNRGIDDSERYHNP